MSSGIPVDRYLELAEVAARIRRSLDEGPVDTRDVIVAVRGDSIVLTGFVRQPEDVQAVRRDAREATGPVDVVDEIAVAVGHSPRVDLPDADLLLPSPDAAGGDQPPARR